MTTRLNLSKLLSVHINEQYMDIYKKLENSQINKHGFMTSYFNLTLNNLKFYDFIFVICKRL